MVPLSLLYFGLVTVAIGQIFNFLLRNFHFLLESQIGEKFIIHAQRFWENRLRDLMISKKQEAYILKSPANLTRNLQLYSTSCLLRGLVDLGSVEGLEINQW